MKQAVILAAGEGQRLRPFTVNRPKVMLSVADKPILHYVVAALAASGIRRIVMVVGYRRQQIFDAMGSGEQYGVDITYINQEKQLGTAHALEQAKAVVDEEFLVLPGDNLIAADTIAGFVAVKPGAVLIKRVDDPRGYGLVTLAGGNVRHIEEKPKESGSSSVNTGIYSFTRDIFRYIEEPRLGIPDVINQMIEKGVNLSAVETKGTWLDVVYPWDILRLNDMILQRSKASVAGHVESGVSLKGEVVVGKDTVVRSGSYIVGPVIIGSGCDIGPSVSILPATSIGNNVVVSAFTQVKNRVIGDDVAVGPGSFIEDSVIDRGCVIKGRFTAVSGACDVRLNGEYHRVSVGAMLGEHCRLDSGVVAQPGVAIGNRCEIGPLKVVTGRIPDGSLVV